MCVFNVVWKKNIFTNCKMSLAEQELCIEKKIMQNDNFVDNNQTATNNDVYLMDKKVK